MTRRLPHGLPCLRRRLSSGSRSLGGRSTDRGADVGRRGVDLGSDVRCGSSYCRRDVPGCLPYFLRTGQSSTSGACRLGRMIRHLVDEGFRQNAKCCSTDFVQGGGDVLGEARFGVWLCSSALAF